MAARTKKIRHDDETRAKIQAAQIINRFMDCVNGEVLLDAQQVSCGKALLNKVLPDLSSAELKAEVTVNPLQTLLDSIDGKSRRIPAADR